MDEPRKLKVTKAEGQLEPSAEGDVEARLKKVCACVNVIFATIVVPVF